MAACRTLWEDLTTKRLYVTGGLGPSARNEGFTADYDLPNETAYAETCAAVGLVFWAHRMLLVERDARYADMMELALYNGAASGLAQDGEHFFYDNPLASRGEHRRWTWHRCPCCPPNIGRLVASLGQYVCSTGPGEAAVHLYIAGEARLAVRGVNVTLSQATQYPWDGAIDVAVDPERAGRIRAAPAHSGVVPHRATRGQRQRRAHRAGAGPRLCARETALAEGRRGAARPRHAGGADLCAPRRRGGRRPRRIEARPDRLLSRGRGQRRAAASHRAAAVLPRRSALRRRSPRRRRHADGAGGGDPLRRRSALSTIREPPETQPITLRAIPYSAWSNRETGEMSVWIREV